MLDITTEVAYGLTLIIQPPTYHDGKMGRCGDGRWRYLGLALIKV
ncbi:hypothetical protein [Okeania sp. SIO3B5]|nr:hypothetical protein [Okeania sp. SIO3B5]